jgi:ubiquinone/menaquinone biosynthesis C-methylase UbiE
MLNAMTTLNPTLQAREAAPNTSAPSPALLFDTINAYQKTAAIRAAIELDIFSALADSPATADTVAHHAKASPRAIRILCDFLTVLGFLTKTGDRYGLTPDSAVFLTRKSPAYAGGTLEFLLSDPLRGAFDCLTAAVRNGGTAQSREGSVAPEHPMWISFARSMGALMTPGAGGLVELIALDPEGPTKVLDVAAGHGVWGLAFAKRHPLATVVALDWAPVLEVARENARAAGVADRFSTIAGSAFDVELGSNYDVVLLPNFLHHFNKADGVRFLKRAHAALRPGGTVAIVEFVPNEDRVTPPGIAGFSLIMLATTPEGDAYTLAEYSDMLARSGFTAPVQHSLPASLNVALVATKA